jgi:hypothetical protein
MRSTTHPLTAQRFSVRENPKSRFYVECYAGRTTDERVRADDGNTYVLRHDQEKDEWGLESFRSGKQGIIATDPELWRFLRRPTIDVRCSNLNQVEVLFGIIF